MGNVRQPGMFDEEFRLREISEHGDPLEKLNELMDWKIFRQMLQKAFKKEAEGPGGRPPYEYVMMFKILLLQRMYNLSDDKIEYWIKDRLSFQRFLNLRLDDQVPDRTTIWLFREALAKKGMVEKLFKRFNRYLEKRKILVNKGSIVDASFVEAPRQRNTKDENKEIKGGGVPKDWEGNEAKLRQKDVDARWTKKNNETHYGYKNHVKVERKTKLIKRYTVTDASVHDSQPIGDLLDKDDRGKSLHGDSAYSGEPVDQKLRRRGVINKTHEKGYRNKPLTKTQEKRNTRKSRIRARVEHIFGYVHNSMGGSTLRSIGLTRATAVIGLMNLTYNIARFVQLVRT